MDIYVIVWNDRHADTEVIAFEQRESALQRARTITAEYEAEEGQLNPAMVKSGWVYYANLNEEGDHIFVQRTTLQAKES